MPDFKTFMSEALSSNDAGAELKSVLDSQYAGVNAKYKEDHHIARHATENEFDSDSHTEYLIKYVPDRKVFKVRVFFNYDKDGRETGNVESYNMLGTWSSLKDTISAIFDQAEDDAEDTAIINGIEMIKNEFGWKAFKLFDLDFDNVSGQKEIDIGRFVVEQSCRYGTDEQE